MPAQATSQVQQTAADANVDACGLNIGSAAGRGQPLDGATPFAERRFGEHKFTETLIQASLTLTAGLDPAQVLDRILELVLQVLPGRAAAVLLLEDGQIWLARQRGLDDQNEALSLLQSGLALDSLPLLKTACKERQTLLVQDVSQAEAWRPLPGLEWIRSLGLAPLIEGTDVAGLLLLLGEDPDTFPAESPRPLEAFAAQAALAVHRGRWRPQELANVRMADILCSASLALTETLDLDTVLGTVLDYLAALVPFDGGNVCLLEPGSRMTPRATRGWAQLPGGLPCQGRILDAWGRQRLEALFNTGSSILIEDRRQRPDWEPCRGLAYAQSCMVVPLMVDGRIVGLCELGKRQPGFFSRQHLRWVEALVGQAEVAIRNAQLFEQIRALSRHLVEAQENERRLIAHELHDEAGQALTSLKVQLKLLERQAGDPLAIQERTAGLIGQVEDVMEGLHRLAAGLRPPSLDHLGLVAALRQYCASLDHPQGLTVEFEAAGPAERLPPEVETAAYRIVQEALLNVLRHAGATRACVVLEWRDDRLVAIIEDDGQGFDPAAVALKGRLGLLGMRERAQSLGGTLTLESAPGRGTTVLVEVPYAH